MKKILKIALGITAATVVAIGAVSYFTTDMVDATDGFLTSVKNNKLAKAYSWLSEDFKASTSLEDLKQFVEKNGLNNYQQSNWSSRSIQSGQGRISGSVITESGNVVPLQIGFINGKDGWKIHSIRKPPAGLQSNSASLDIPDERQAIQLIRKTINRFAISLKQKSMQIFHDHIASIWQQQFSVKDLDQAYQAFYDADIDLTILDDLTPQFKMNSEPGQNGVLLITGHYPTQPSRLYFEQKYVYEGLGWKLVGFSANIK